MPRVPSVVALMTPDQVTVEGTFGFRLVESLEEDIVSASFDAKARVAVVTT